MAHSYDSFEVSTNDETAPLIQKPRATRKARPSRCCKYCCICFLSILAILVLACGILAILLSIDLGKSPPQAGTSLDSPGVGFDLTAEYSTAAIRDKDGTSTSVASIPYDGDMVEMMQRMSSKKQYSDPYQDYCSDPWGSLSWKNSWKRIRRNLGLPSTQDVARLAKVIEKLKDVVENHLHISVDSALVAVPLFPQLCPDHFEEAAKLNGMAAIRLGGETDQLYELEAAYAGYGMGLCQDYMNSTSCRAEENNMSASAILSILYTDTALMVDWYPLSKVRVQSRNSLTYRTDWTLGSRNVPREGSQEVENYWQHINTTIADTMLNNPITTNGSQIDKLILLGESSKHAIFKSVVQDTMLQLRPKLPVIFDDDVVYAAARGAAEMAKRAGDLAVLQRESERTEQ